MVLKLFSIKSILHKNGAFYTKGLILPGSSRDVEANEIATKGVVDDKVAAAVAGVEAELHPIAKSGMAHDLEQEEGEYLILNCNF